MSESERTEAESSVVMIMGEDARCPKSSAAAVGLRGVLTKSHSSALYDDGMRPLDPALGEVGERGATAWAEISSDAVARSPGCAIEGEENEEEGEEVGEDDEEVE